MVNQVFDESVRQMHLINSEESELQSDKQDKVQMKKQLGLLEGIAIILGIIFGSGMFKYAEHSLSHLISKYRLHVYLVKINFW